MPFPGTVSRLILVLLFLDWIGNAYSGLFYGVSRLLEPAMLVLARRAIFD